MLSRWMPLHHQLHGLSMSGRSISPGLQEVQQICHREWIDEVCPLIPVSLAVSPEVLEETLQVRGRMSITSESVMCCCEHCLLSDACAPPTFRRTRLAARSYCFFSDGVVVDCSERLPPLGWSRWIYFCSKLPASKFFRVEFDIEDGEMMYAFRLWGRHSLMSCSEATEAIEESRTGSKRLTEAERDASPLQLCVRWNPEAYVREQQAERAGTRPYPGSIEKMRFTGSGWEVIPPLTFEPSDMMLLSKHEICVLAKHPKLKQFIFDWRSRTDHILDEWESAFYRRRAEHKSTLERRRDYVVEEEEDRAYKQRDMREEIRRVLAASESVDLVGTRRRRLDESLVTEASSFAAENDSVSSSSAGAAAAAMEDM